MRPVEDGEGVWLSHGGNTPYLRAASLFILWTSAARMVSGVGWRLLVLQVQDKVTPGSNRKAAPAGGVAFSYLEKDGRPTAQLNSPA